MTSFTIVPLAIDRWIDRVPVWIRVGGCHPVRSLGDVVDWGCAEMSNLSLMDAVIPRRHYAALDHCTYLNQASLGLIPRGSIEIMTKFLTDVAQHGNVRLSDVAETEVLDELRGAGARVLGAPLESVGIVSGASEGLNQAAAMLASADGAVVLVSTDFPCVTAPWLRAQQRLSLEIRWVEDRPDADLTTALVEAVEGSTTVVCFSAVQYATGTSVDVSQVVRRAHAVGAAVVVDATQMAGAEPVSMSDWRTDVMVCSGYKWLSGHGGVALLVVAESLLAETPSFVGWMGTVDPFDFDAQQLRLADDARRYQLSTMAYSSAIGATTSLKLLDDTGIDVIARHAGELSDELVARVASMGWRPFRPLTSASASRHIVALEHDDHNAAEVQRFLADQHRTYVSSRGGRIRVSLHGYNDRSDIEALTSALAAFA